ncbi:MAG: hypothetical protein PHE83_03395 [Opitutaceae bacterium]|nr:hypothetical protein [Opitutaceae bacterium]
MAFGLAWLAVGAVWLVARSDLLATHHAVPGTVALVHAWVLGFLLPVTFGAVYQLLPVVLGVSLASTRRAWIHCGLHAIGATGVVAAMAIWRMELVAAAAVPVVIGVILFADNVWRTLARTHPWRDPVALAFALAAGWLVATVLAGGLLAINRRWFFLTLSPLALLRAHAHLGIAGFFLTLLQGAAFRLVPMFTLGEVRNWRRVWTGLLATQLGLAGLVPALAWEWHGLEAWSAIVLTGGIALSGWELTATLASRRKRPLAPGLRGFAGGAALLGVATATGLGLALAAGRPAADDPRWAVLYGTVALLGGLVPMVLGMLCKIVPFLVWLRVYAPRLGRRPTPPATGLAWPALEHTWLGLHGLGLAVLLAGVTTINAFWLRLGAGLLAAGIGALLVNLGLVFAHLRHARELPVPSALQPAAS